MTPTSTTELLRPFLRKTVFVALIALILYFAVDSFFDSHFLSAVTPWMVLFFLVLYNYLYYRHLKALQSKATKFVNNFIFSSGFKLILFLFIILGYSFIFRDDAIHFILTFFILYLLFTIVELLHIKGSVKK
jgi:L-asparagine transporter-like permease